MDDFIKKNRNVRNNGFVDGFKPQGGTRLSGPAASGGVTNQQLDSMKNTAEGWQSSTQRIGSQPNDASSPAGDHSLGFSQGVDVPGKRNKRPMTFRRASRMIGATVGLLVVSGLLVGGYIFGKAWFGAHKVFKGGGSSVVLFSKDVKPEQLKGEGDGRVNILLAGVGGGDHPGADLTDSIMIASIDPVAKDAALLSIPRDLWVNVPGFWTMKINASYASAKERALDNGKTESQAIDEGLTTMEQTVEMVTGLPIHYHAVVNFQAFKEGVDAVGGVDVDVKEALYDYNIAWENNNNDLIADVGPQHFDGSKALLYARSRYTTSDFARGQRQRELILALKEKLLKAGTFSNPSSVSKLIDALGNNVTINATMSEMMRMYDITKDIQPAGIVSLGLTDEPNALVTTGTINDLSVVIPKAGDGEFGDIQNYVRNAIKDPYLKSEAATIAVLNGTTEEGLAAKKAEELKSYGYDVTVIDIAPTQDYEKTVIYDRTADVKKFTKSYLEKRLGVIVMPEPTTAPLPVTTDFVVVLGSNEITPTSN